MSGSGQIQHVETVRYHSQDSVNNLRVRVTLRRISGPRVVQVNQEEAEEGEKENRKLNPEDDTKLARGTSLHTNGLIRPRSPRDHVCVSRVFGWQEKVRSKAELAHETDPTHPELVARTKSPAGALAHALQTGAATTAALIQRAASWTLRRGNGTSEHAGEEGGMLFTYVFGDEFCDTYEKDIQVTTSSQESDPRILQAVMRRRKKVSSVQPMFIMADLGDKGSQAGVREHVLAGICAYPDGSMDMRPGFSRPSKKYRFEDETGCIYEYTLENASPSEVPEIVRREAKLVRAANKRVEAIRRNAMNLKFTPAPGPSGDALRLLLLCEIVSATEFKRDRLYVEYRVAFDPACWSIRNPEKMREDTSGSVSGVTQVSKMVKYPPDPTSGQPPGFVAHWAHPVEVELVASKCPSSAKWPVLLLQVCSYDRWDRYTSEGYGWVPLSGLCPGSITETIHTWKPTGSYRDKTQEYFIGGSLELEDLSYLAVPRGFEGKMLNKYGFQTQTSGKIKVRVNSVVQQKSEEPPRRGSLQRQESIVLRGPSSLAAVVERAKARLREARGGDIELKPGVMSSISRPPDITMEPQDASARTGETAKFEVDAEGGGSLRYQWYKNGRRLHMATANKSTLVLVGVEHQDSGKYACKVSNKDGATRTVEATLSVRARGRGRDKRNSRFRGQGEGIAQSSSQQNQPEERRRTVGSTSGPLPPVRERILSPVNEEHLPATTEETRLYESEAAGDRRSYQEGGSNRLRGLPSGAWEVEERDLQPRD